MFPVALFAASTESFLTRIFSDPMNPFPMFICLGALGVLVALAGIARHMVRDRREQTLRHEERMAMIDAGLHPDFPPEVPAQGEADNMKQTLEYQDQV
jgi:hypothetical protein